jgi:hypothetical protein
LAGTPAPVYLGDHDGFRFGDARPTLSRSTQQAFAWVRNDIEVVAFIGQG